MFAGAQIITTKLVHRNKRKEIIDCSDDDKIAKDLANIAIVVPRRKAAIVVESQAEKLERKALAEERRHERFLEQQIIARHMEDLMERVLHETSLSKKDEENLREKVKTVTTKVDQYSDKINLTSHPPPSSSSSQIYSKVSNQRSFLLWYDKNFN